MIAPLFCPQSLDNLPKEFDFGSKATNAPSNGTVITINFNKIFSSPPTVVAGEAGYFAQTSVEVTYRIYDITTSSFKVVIIKNGAIHSPTISWIAML